MHLQEVPINIILNYRDSELGWPGPTGPVNYGLRHKGLWASLACLTPLPSNNIW